MPRVEAYRLLTVLLSDSTSAVGSAVTGWPRFTLTAEANLRPFIEKAKAQRMGGKGMSPETLDALLARHRSAEAPPPELDNGGSDNEERG